MPREASTSITGNDAEANPRENSEFCSGRRMPRPNPAEASRNARTLLSASSAKTEIATMAIRDGRDFKLMPDALLTRCGGPLVQWLTRASTTSIPTRPSGRFEQHKDCGCREQEGAGDDGL